MKRPFEAIVIGASAGATEALSKILCSLPKTYPLPIIVGVHLPVAPKSIMVELLNSKCQIEIKEAEDKEPILGQKVYFAPPDYHLLVELDKYFSLSVEEPVLHSRPSINVLFETAARAYGNALLGIVLTGANEDGAEGLKAIMNAGGRGLVQDPDEAYAKAMPQAALELCPEAKVLNLKKVTQFLREVGAS